MSNFKEYPIYKKRDGQSFNYVSYIFADSFDDAKKQFAENMTKDNWEQSNNIVWLDKENDGVGKTGWYDLDSSVLYGNDEGEINYSESKMELFCSEEAIKEGFDSFSEDVYTWELREPLDYIKIIDLEDFNNEKENYSFFMAVEGEMFYLYNGEFSKIAEHEGVRGYSDTNAKFMGSQISETDFIKSYLS